MSKPTLSDIEHVFREIITPFYSVYRHTPLRTEPGRYENDAEHSWSTALLACALAPHIDPTLDIGKIAQFATVHDLVEVYAGDTCNFASAEKKATKESREQAALQKLESTAAAMSWIVVTIKEYESQKSSEAKFVKSVDKLLPLLFDYVEEGLFYHENSITIEQWKEQLARHREKASKHAGVFEYYEELWNLLLANPHFFHPSDKTD